MLWGCEFDAEGDGEIEHDDDDVRDFVTDSEADAEIDAVLEDVTEDVAEHPERRYGLSGDSQTDANAVVFASIETRVFCFSVRKIAAVAFARLSQRLHFVPIS